MAAHRFTRRSSSLRIKPLVLALAGVFPLSAAMAGAPDLRLPGQPTANSGVVFTPTNSRVTVKTTTTATSARLDVTQQDQRAITQWASFNVGSDASVNFYMPNASSAMLARVLPATAAPQQILGSVKTLYLDSVGKEHVGGELFLINASGWLFGSKATVNVGSLVASALDIRNDDFLSGLGSINRTEATFSWKYAGGAGVSNTASLYQADGLIQVDKGANITTESGGRVFLFAPQVLNKGHIETPDGQTVMAGGGEVYLNNPVHEKLYASEVNPNVPAVRGLLVEVNNGAHGETGSVTNAGEIISARGNTTLVAMAVRQSGHIAASTSSTANGSVVLTARSNVVAKLSDDLSAVLKQANQGGSLTLDKDSRIDLLPDESVAPTTASTPFAASRVELSGKTIDILDGASIVAPGATVKVRAEVTPQYMGSIVPATFDSKASFGTSSTVADARGNSVSVPEQGARITVGAHTVIDVSGTTTAQVDAAKRNYITPSLVTNSDLKDAPLQKSGPIFHKEDATFDVRQSVPMFSSTQGYKDAATVTATERLSVGGSVDLHSTGDVVTHATSLINVSGGQVNFSAVGLTPGDAPVLLTQVKDQAGNIFTLNTAPADRTYTLYKSRLVQEAAYFQGSAAGSLKVTGSHVVMPGQLKASTTTGARQLAGQDALAKRANVTVNTWLRSTDLNAQTAKGTPDLATVTAAVRQADIVIDKDLTGAASDYWTQVESSNGAAVSATLPAGSQLSPSILNTQASTVTLASDGGVHWLGKNDQTFVPGAVLSIKTNGDQGIQIDSSVRDASGTVTLNAGDLTDVGGNVLMGSQGVRIGAGQKIDVSGRFVNQVIDGQNGAVVVAPVGMTGGSINVLSSSNVMLGQGSLLDVSGGALLTSAGVKGQAAGSLTLASGLTGQFSVDQGNLRGFGLAQGGTLSLTANNVVIGQDAQGSYDPAHPDQQVLALTPGYFTEGGFASFKINGTNSLVVKSGTPLTPVQKNWLATAALSRASTDTAMSTLVREYDRGEHVRTPTSLSLRSSNGSVTVERGALIQTDAQAKVQLQASTLLDFEGSLVDHGGAVSMSLDPARSPKTSGTRAEEGVVWLGQGSSVDVSGLAITALNTGVLHQGTVLAGGSISLSAPNDANNEGGMVVFTKGASLRLDGAADTYDTRVATSAGSVYRKVLTASAGGTLDVQSSRGAVLEGTVSAQGGSSTAVAGKLNVVVGDIGTPVTNSPSVYQILLQQDEAQRSQNLGVGQRASLLQDDGVWGNATISSSWLNHAGFADVSLVSGGRIEAVQSARMAASRSLTLSARALSVAPGQSLTLAAPHISLGDALVSGLNSGLSFDGTATTGSGSVTLAAQYVDLNDHVALQGIGSFQIKGLSGSADSAASAVELRSSKGNAAALDTVADVSISAGQIFPDSDTSYTVNASGHTVSFLNGDASSAKPMSAGGQLTVNADHIVQGGVLRAPFGQITLNANRIDVLDHSVTSVSGAGLLVPFGSTVNGATWVYNGEGDTRTGLLGKQIVLNAGTSGTGSLNVADTASIDTRGGGDVYAREFIPGPGGSKDIFAGAANGAFAVVPYAFANQAGFAISDRAILNASDSAGQKASITAGQLITFGANGVLPADTYVVLPAAYASMPGAYLIKADTASSRSGAADLGAPAIKLDDGSVSVAGKISYAGTHYQDAVGSRFVVMNNKVSSSYSQVNLTSGSAFFAAQAAKNHGVTPSLAMDGGEVRLIAPVLNKLASGVLSMAGDATASDARGGALEIGVNELRVSDQPGQDTTVSEISLSGLNASGAQTIVLGGTLGDSNAAGERVLNVTASTVTVDGSGNAGALKAGDVTLVAQQAVNLKHGAAVQATGVVASSGYHIEGDGAGVRVSSSGGASLSRSGVAQASGVLNMDAGTSLQSDAGLIAMEATQAVNLDASAQIHTKYLTLGAPRLALGAAPSALNALNLSGKLLDQLNLVGNLTLRSYSSIDFFKTAAGGDLTVGGTALKSLVLDAGTLQGHDGVSVNLLAGQVTLSNTSGATAVATRDSGDVGTLTIQATDAQGDVRVATGANVGTQTLASAVGISGFLSTTLNAQRSVVAAGSGDHVLLAGAQVSSMGGLNAAGDLTIQSASLTATSASNTMLAANGRVSIKGNGQSAKAVSGLGAHLTVQGETLVQGGLVELNSGALTLHATGSLSGGVPALTLTADSKTLLNGVSVTVGNKTVDTQGGIAHLVADSGDILMNSGAEVNASAAGSAAAGAVNIQAVNGRVDLNGRLLATSQAGQADGALMIDAQSGVNLDAVADTVSTTLSAGLQNFSGQVVVHSRGNDDLHLSHGKQIGSASVALVSDGGNMTLAGSVSANTPTGGSILLAAGGDLALDGAALSARASSTAATNPYSVGRIDLQSSQGVIKLINGTQVDLSAAGAATQDGVLAMRALRTTDGAGVKIDPINAVVNGARAVQIEGVKVWDHTTTGAAVTSLDTLGKARGALGLKTLQADATSFTANGDAIKVSLAGGNAALAGLMEVRVGEEVRAANALTLNSDWNLGTPINLTLRAGGDLSVLGSLSAGFSTATASGLVQPGAASDLRLVGGANITGADVMGTQPGGAGNVLIGAAGSSKTVLVRSTTGNVQLAAANDVQLVSAGAAVYTTGQQADSSLVAAWQGLPTGPTKLGSVRTTVVTAANPGVGSIYAPMKSGATILAPFYTGGGNVSVTAGHDVLGSIEASALATNPANWFYTTYKAANQQTSWWTRYDKFTQGVATLGGGNVTVKAGGSVQDLQVAAAGSGFKQASTGGVSRDFGAGALLVSADQRILGTTAVNTGSSLRLSAGQDIGSSTRASDGNGLLGTTVVSFNGSNSINALGRITLAAVSSAARASQFLVWLKGTSAATSDVASWYATTVGTLSAQSTSSIQSAGGDVYIGSGSDVLNPLLGFGDVGVTDAVASDFVVTAPIGSVDLEARLNQALPASGGQFKVLAGQSLTLAELKQHGAAPGGANDAASSALGFDTDPNRASVVLVAGQGDLSLGQYNAPSTINLVRPLDAYAGRDLLMRSELTIQHQGGAELSLLQAGRDILFDKPASVQETGLTVRGPGDVLLVAGRDINLGTGGGVVTTGNSGNTVLPAQSANINLMAGTKLANLDATLALSEGRVPQLLGGLAYLTAQDADTELASVRAALGLLGASLTDFDASFTRAKAAFVGTLGTAYASQSTEQRVAAFSGLSDDVKALFIKDYLSEHVLGNAGAASASAPQDFHLGSLIQKALLAQAPGARSTLAAQLAQTLQSPYQAALLSFMAQQSGRSDLSVAQAMDAFDALPQARQALFMQQVLFGELRQAGRSAVKAGSDVQKTADYQRGYDAMAALFSPAHAQASGDLSMPLTKVRSFQGGNVNMLLPVGNVNGGLTSGNSTDFGVVALAGGAVNAATYGNYIVNTSRVFTLGGGDLLMWSSEGNVDAGKGARTVAGAPAPVFYLDNNGNLQVDTSAAISGSGIASSHDLDVYAPHGIVDSGDAGLRSAGAASLGGARVVCIGCSFGVVVGLPSAAPVVTPVAATSVLPDNTKAGPAAGETEDAKKKKKKRQIQLDFLGFGVAFANPIDWIGVDGLSTWWMEAQAKPVVKSKSLLLSMLDEVRRLN